MEASGYAASMAEAFQEPVLLVEWYYDDPQPPVRYNAQSVIEVCQ